MVRNPVAVWMVCWVNGSSIVGGLGMRQSGETFMRSLSVAAGWSAIAWQCHAIGAVCTCALVTQVALAGGIAITFNALSRSENTRLYLGTSLPATASLGPHANPCLVFSSPRHLVKVELNLYQPPIGESLGKIVTNHLVKVSQPTASLVRVKLTTSSWWKSQLHQFEHQVKENPTGLHQKTEWNNTTLESRIYLCTLFLRVNFHEALKPWA